MSIDSLIANPIIIDELKSVFGGSGTGIETLSSPDNNLVTSVVGTEGKISLANNLSVAGGISMANYCTLGGVLNVGNLIQLNGNEGSAGQVITSQGASTGPIWATPAVSVGLKFIGLYSGNCNSHPDDVQLALGTGTLTGLTIGKTYYCICMGTYNNRGTTPPTSSNTLVSYSGLVGVTQLNTYETQIIGVATNNKINYCYVLSNTASASTETIDNVIYISGSPQINTISSDTNDYYNILAFQII